MRFLCISDIHGHAAALRKVLEEGTARGFDQLVACGDLLFPGPDPLETWNLLIEHRALCVQGLTDRAVGTVEPNDLKAENDDQQRRIDQLLDFHDRLGDIIVARLARLNQTARLPLESGHEMVVVHGSPSDPSEAMTADMDDDELNALIADDPADLIVCGASHVPFVRELGEIRVVNVGSVGESPTPGIANATIITTSPLSVDITPFSVELDTVR